MCHRNDRNALYQIRVLHCWIIVAETYSIWLAQGLRCRHTSIRQLKARQQGVVCNRGWPNTTSEMRTDQMPSQAAQAKVKRPKLTVLEVKLKKGPVRKHNSSLALVAYRINPETIGNPIWCGC
eukprot:161106-Prorocentrum_minimum.AAC.5